MFFSSKFCNLLLLAFVVEIATMPESSSKGSKKNGKLSSADTIVQLTQNQLEELIQNMILKATKSLKDEIAALKNVVSQLQDGEKFISDNHDDLSKTYNDIIRTDKQQNQEIKQLNKRAENLRKRSSDEERNTDEVEQHDRRQNLEFQGVPQTEKDVIQIILDLSEKLEVSLKKNDISIAHRLPQRQRPGRTRSSSIKRHPTIIVRFVSRLIRNQVYANRYKAKYIKDFPVEGMEKLYVNENLIPRRKNLFWQTKPAAKELSNDYFWTNNGQIYIRKDEESNKIILEVKLTWTICSELCECNYFCLDFNNLI